MAVPEPRGDAVDALGQQLSNLGLGGRAAPRAPPPPAGGSGRHDVGRCPELDYFARKLESGKKGDPHPHWKLPYGKAGQAAALPDTHASPAAYLTAMQAHTALEFQVPGCCCPGASDAVSCGAGPGESLARAAGAQLSSAGRLPAPSSPLPPSTTGRHRQGSGAGRGQAPRARPAVVAL